MVAASYAMRCTAYVAGYGSRHATCDPDMVAAIIALSRTSRTAYVLTWFAYCAAVRYDVVARRTPGASRAAYVLRWTRVI
jgi:hypothetical protein